MMRLVFVALMVFSVAASGQDNDADSYCNTKFWSVNETLAWRVNRVALVSAFSAWDPSSNLHLTQANSHLYVDRLIQNIARHSRARFRHRVIPYESDCSAVDWFEDEPCITAHVNGESNSCRGDPDSWAWAGCNAAGCDIHFCVDNLTPSEGVWADGVTGSALMHEFGHVLGQDHVVEDNGYMCSGSDGCEGELMCPNAGNNFRDGDLRGFRERYNGHSRRLFNRNVYFGARSNGGAGRVVSSSSFEASFQPRIDCAAVQNDNATCVMLVHDQQNDTSQRTRLMALNGPTASDWSSAQTIVTSTLDYALPGDVAIDPWGSQAVYTRVRRSSSLDSVTVTHVDLVTGQRAVTELGYSSIWPVRVAYNDDVNGFVVIGYNASNRWEVTVVRKSAGGLEFQRTRADFVETPAADFDFDCRTNIFGPTDCVLASPLYVDEGGGGVGRIYSRVFRLTNGPVVPLPTYIGGWQRSQLADAQAVLGLSVSPSSTYVNVGVSRLGGTVNTAVLEYPGMSVSATPSASLLERSDAGGSPCSDAKSTGNFNMGASTPHGGVSHAYCPTCPTNKLRSLHLGTRVDNDTFCH